MGTPEAMMTIPAAPAAPIQLTDYVTREAWLASRNQGIGASESAALFGVSPYDTAMSLWAKKTGKVKDTRVMPEYATWGTLLEPVIANVYQIRTGRKIWQGSEFAVAQHPTIACMRATPDRFVIECPDRLPLGLLQVKNTHGFRPEVWEDGVPDWVEIQVQHEMAVTGLTWASVAVCIGGNEFRYYDLERNDAFIAELEIQCQMFWELVQSGEQPALDISERTLKTIKKLHPNDNGEQIALPEQAIEWWNQLEAAKEHIKAGEANKLEAEERLMDAIGDATYGLLPNGRRLVLKTSANPGHNTKVEPYTYRTLRIEKEWTPQKRRRR